MDTAKSDAAAEAGQAVSILPSKLEDLENLTMEEKLELRRLLKQSFVSSWRGQYWSQEVFWWVPQWAGMWGTPGSHMIQAEFIKDGTPTIMNNIGNEEEMCNKATAFYWMESAQTISGDTKGLVILGSIYKYWTEALDRPPYVQLGDFFAAPISVKVKSATTISEIVYAHNQIYAQVQEHLRSPKPAKEQYFRLHPLFKALITVFDEYKFVEGCLEKDGHGVRRLDNVAQHQSILLIRTGNEDKLSGPISFESLKNEALPLARDEDIGGLDVIRVPLRTGVRFVADLILREDAAHPDMALANTTNSPESPFSKYERKAAEDETEEIVAAAKRGKISTVSSLVQVKEALFGRQRPGKPDLFAYDEPVYDFARVYA